MPSSDDFGALTWAWCAAIAVEACMSGTCTGTRWSGLRRSWVGAVVVDVGSGSTTMALAAGAAMARDARAMVMQRVERDMAPSFRATLGGRHRGGDRDGASA